MKCYAGPQDLPPFSYHSSGLDELYSFGPLLHTGASSSANGVEVEIKRDDTCGGLKENGSPKGVALLGGVALLEDMCHCGGRL